MKAEGGYLTCEHCGAEVDGLIESAYRVVSNPVAVPMDDGSIYDVTDGYEVDWENEYALGRVFTWPCCGERVEDEELLWTMYGDLPGHPSDRDMLSMVTSILDAHGRDMQ